MSSSTENANEILNLAALLAPVPGNNPAGADLSYTVWSDLQDLRREEDRQGESKPVEWPKIISDALDALKNKTKDLRIAFYLTEALVKELGFVGLRDGLRLLRGLIEQDRFWTHLYPVARNGSFKARASALRLNDKLDIAVKQVALTQTVAGESYCYLQWLESEQFKIPENVEELEYDERERINALMERANAEKKITSVQWCSAVRATSTQLFSQTFSLLEECRSELAALEPVLKTRFTYVWPGLERLKQALDAALTSESPDRNALRDALKGAQAALEKADGLETFKDDLTRRLDQDEVDPTALKRLSTRLIVREIPPLDALKQTLKELSELIQPLAKGETSGGSAPSQGTKKSPPPPSNRLEKSSPLPDSSSPPQTRRLDSRQDALARLTEVLAYFRQTEPYNPASNLIERAIRWGNLSLDQWLPQVIGDEDLLRALQERLGIVFNGQSPDKTQAQAKPPIKVPSNGFHHRNDALAQLREVVAYFRATEPHNPAICLVERSIAWSDMSLDQWLAQVIENEDALRRLQGQLGGKPEQEQ